jgi:hypothetical protein
VGSEERDSLVMAVVSWQLKGYPERRVGKDHDRDLGPYR